MRSDFITIGPFKNFGEKRWSLIQQELTKPNPNFGFKDSRKDLLFYKESECGNYMEIPRNFQDLNHEKEDLYEGKKINIKYKGSLRDYQKKYFEKNPELLTLEDKVIEAGAGSGKTNMSLYLIAHYNRKTLVMAPTDFLCKQYFARANEFLEGARVYMASATKKIDISNADVVVITYDLLVSRKFGEEFWSEFGHFVVDEAHKMGTELYQSILEGCKCRYRTALSATFRRADGLEKVLEYHFGKRIVMENVNPLVHVVKYETGLSIPSVVTPNLLVNEKKGIDYRERFFKLLDGAGIDYELRESSLSIEVQELEFLIGRMNPKSAEDRRFFGYMKKVLRNLEETSYVAMDNYTSDLYVRKVMAVRLIEKLLEEGRKVLLISKRKNVLFALNEMLSRRGIESIVVVRETDVANNLEVLEDQKVILGINKIANEGFDVDYLDTLIIYHPIGDTEQALGRVARIKEDKKTPKAYYLVDNSPLSEGLWKKANKIIPRNGKVVETVKRNTKQNGKTKNKLGAWGKSIKPSKDDGGRNTFGGWGRKLRK